MRDIRLGDDIDDYCVRCKRIMNHNVVSVLNGKPAKVRCRTCHSDHDYRNEQAPPPKVDPRKAALFNEVLKKVSPGDAAPAEADPELELETDAEPVAELEETETAAAAAPVEEESPKPKRGRGRPKK
ncbi:MAG TPA: hypothetical protein VMS37_19380 [Verrucomicrobiae bacterium]|nr:hypothetical protein [Verrucomicrobiae bacterium]